MTCVQVFVLFVGCSSMVGLLVVLIVRLFFSFWAMPGLCCFRCVTHTYRVEVVNDLLPGDIPHCHLLLASRLIAQEKPQGGVRPVAIEEAFLRLSNICASSTAQNAADLLAPLHIGMGISEGAEIPGHSLRPDFCNPDVDTVQVDLQNAFNLANRDDMVHAVADKLPSLLPYVLMAYQ